MKTFDYAGSNKPQEHNTLWNIVQTVLLRSDIKTQKRSFSANHSFLSLSVQWRVMKINPLYTRSNQTSAVFTPLTDSEVTWRALVTMILPHWNMRLQIVLLLGILTKFSSKRTISYNEYFSQMETTSLLNTLLNKVIIRATTLKNFNVSIQKLPTYSRLLTYDWKDSASRRPCDCKWQLHVPISFFVETFWLQALSLFLVTSFEFLAGQQ